MQFRSISSAVAIATAILLSGCVSTSRVLEMGKDTYSVTATADGMRDAASARESAFQAASQKCDSLGKRFTFLHESINATRMGIDSTVSLTFRCLSETDPEYVRPTIKRSPEVVIEDARSSGGSK